VPVITLQREKLSQHITITNKTKFIFTATNLCYTLIVADHADTR